MITAKYCLPLNRYPQPPESRASPEQALNVVTKEVTKQREKLHSATKSDDLLRVLELSLLSTFKRIASQI